VLSASAKYYQSFLIGLQSNLVYRLNFAVRGFFSLFHLAVVFILWGAAYAGTPHIGGFSFEQTLTYFLVMLVMQFFVGAFNEDYQISEEIRSGLINQFILKPINYFSYRFSIFVAARLVSGALILIPLCVALPFLHSYLTLPIAYCFGMLTFWFLEIQGFVILSMAIESLLGGQMFPLDLLPAWMLEIAKLLPFYYQTYFPTAILTGRIDLAATYQGFAIQLFWAVALLGLNTVLWRRGLRRHTAVGG
jgi:ABC-2 type transport system permease protein